MQEKPNAPDWQMESGRSPPQRKRSISGGVLAIISLLAIIAVVAAGYVYWQYSTVYPSTDYAYVQANSVQITPLVTGVVTEVSAKEYARVKSGDVLLRIDPAPYEAALKAAQTRLSIAQQQAAGGQNPAAKASVLEAQAAVEQARLELDRATIKAPLDGIVGKVKITKGAVAKAGMPVFPLVDTSSWWVDANFKETDLGRIKVGQEATVEVDLSPSHKFAGHVEAISPASTTSYSLLPPENASGNWVKVTQRFPVRVSLSLQPGEPELRLGASATVTVDTTSKGSESAGR